jgi:DNA gyrase/topoisomerase IV subunit A
MSYKETMSEKHIEVSLDKLAIRKYKNYGVAVLEDRAIPDYRDGMIPVNRRVLWSAYQLGIHSKGKFAKSARIVGDTLGRFHPHGDSSTYSAMVGMTNVGKTINNAHIALLEGEGNWGSFSDKAYAAMRYTECRLSAFSDKVLFNKFYLPVVRMSPNFDSTTTEPVLLPALLPIVFLNGQFGIAPGATTNIPAFKYKSVLKALKTIYENKGVADAKALHKALRFASLFGGEERLDSMDDEAKANRRRVFKTYSGKVRLWGNVTFDEKAKVVRIDRFGMATTAEKVLTKVLELPGVKSALDDSTTGETYGTIRVVLSRNLTTKAYAKLVKQIDMLMSGTENYILNFTERYVDEEGQAQARMKPMSLTDAFQNWVNWRTKLEVAACSYWIKQAEKEIRRLELLMIAVDNRKLIIESLDKDLDEKQLDAWLAAKLKITVEEAHFIYDLKVRQLRKLERKALEASMKEVVTRRKELTARKDAPLPYMAKQLEEFAF